MVALFQKIFQQESRLLIAALFKLVKSEHFIVGAVNKGKKCIVMCLVYSAFW